MLQTKNKLKIYDLSSIQYIFTIHKRMYMDTMIMMEQANPKLENFEKMITDMFSE